jgi:hypothetical protein
VDDGVCALLRWLELLLLQVRAYALATGVGRGGVISLMRRCLCLCGDRQAGPNLDRSRTSLVSWACQPRRHPGAAQRPDPRPWQCERADSQRWLGRRSGCLLPPGLRGGVCAARGTLLPSDWLPGRGLLRRSAGYDWQARLSRVFPDGGQHRLEHHCERGLQRCLPSCQRWRIQLEVPDG